MREGKGALAVAVAGGVLIGIAIGDLLASLRARSARCATPRMADLGSVPNRRSRADLISQTKNSANSYDSISPSPQIELATDNARRMMASDERMTAETVLFVLGQMTEGDAAEEVERMISPSEKLRGAFHRVKDGLQDMQAFNGSPPRPGAPEPSLDPPFLALRPLATPVPRELLETEDVRRCLQGAERWDWDVFACQRASNGHALLALGVELLGPCCERLGVGGPALAAFLSSVEAAYRTDVAYHTAAHAADVLHAASWLLRAGVIPSLAVSEEERPLLELAVLVAAAAHDVAHPGVNGDFLARTSDPLAILYNDRSILENMHAAICFRLLAAADSCFLAALQPAQRSQLRAWVVHMILATDMKGHYQLMARLAEIEPWQAESALLGDEAAFALGVLLHAADLSGPTKPQVVVRWSRLVAEEFFRQGEREAALGLKLTDGFERGAGAGLWAQRNAAFVKFIVTPLFEAVHSAAPEAALADVFEGISTSLQRLEQADPDMPLPHAGSG